MGRRHHELRVWQEGISLVEEIYQCTARFPIDERFGLTSQMRRAAVSIPSNIAEGAARQTRKEFINFLMIARGSLAELETQLIIGERLKYVEEHSETRRSINNLFGKLGALIKSEKQVNP